MGEREQRNSAKCSCTSGFRSPLQYRQGVAQPPSAAPREMWWKGCPDPCAILVLTFPAGIPGPGVGWGQTLWLESPEPSPDAQTASASPPPHPPSPAPKSALLVFSPQSQGVLLGSQNGNTSSLLPLGGPTPPESALAPSLTQAPTPVLNISAACKQPRPAGDPQGNGRSGGCSVPRPGSQGGFGWGVRVMQPLPFILLPPGWWGQDRQCHPSTGRARGREAMWDGFGCSGLLGPWLRLTL